ncbi:MAG TPA: hypothetical protein VN875_21020 [Candidatus Binatus sp.]|jgi:hypothetical protein|nr:hypothetical protein [Candidatus Binatus sp.]
MHCSKKFRTLPWCLLLATSLFLGGFSAALKPSQQTRGDIVSGLQLTIYLDQEKVGSKKPKFRVELRNAGEDDLVLNLGFMLGGKQYPDAIVLTLGDTHGKSRPLQLREPFTVAGRVDPLVLPLPAGATFSISVDFEKYLIMPRPEESDFGLQAGTYTLEAQFTGKGVRPEDFNHGVMAYWQDTVTSNLLRFEVPNP